MEELGDSARRPYYMTNPTWYYYDEETHKHKLTPEAPPEAVKDYNERQKFVDEKGNPKELS